MFWAGADGAITSAIAAVLLATKHSAWLTALVLLFTCSGAIVLIFGSRIRKVRGDEVTFVFLSRAVLHRANAGQGRVRMKADSAENAPPSRPKPSLFPSGDDGD